MNVQDLQSSILLSRISKVGPGKDIGTAQPERVDSPSTSKEKSFDSILDSTEVQFSKHAERRLQSRQIEVSAADKSKLNEAVGALSKKGARDSLVLMGEMAFIVNVPSKTVVTALTQDQMKEQIFTNIDSTMLVTK